MSDSVFISEQYALVDRAVHAKNRRALKRCFVLSLVAHLALAAVVGVGARRYFSAAGRATPELVLVGQTEFKPFPEPELSASPAAETKEEQPPLPVIEKPAPAADKPAPSPDSWTYERFRRKADTSWRDKVAGVTRKSAEQPKDKIVVTKTTPSPVSAANATRTPAVAPGAVNAYVFGLIQMFRSHWSLPEDLAHKLSGHSCEIEIIVDAAGTIRQAAVVRGSGNAVYDFYARDAVLKTGKIVIPPKDLFETLFKDDRITVVFKL